MSSKVKKLCKKAQKGLKNIVSPKRQKREQHSEAPIKPSVEKPTKAQSENQTAEKDLKRGISFRSSFQKAKEKIKSLRTEPKEIKKDSMFKKFKKKVKSLNPIKSKKNKIIGSKKLALLLTAGTIVAILPMFNLPTFPALAITSACVFSINFIAVKTLKKVIKQHKAKAVAEPEKLEDVSVEPAKEESKQVSKDLH